MFALEKYIDIRSRSHTHFQELTLYPIPGFTKMFVTHLPNKHDHYKLPFDSKGDLNNKDNQYSFYDTHLFKNLFRLSCYIIGYWR